MNPRYNVWKTDPKGDKFGPRKNPKDWVPHKGPFKLIKLPPNAGIKPEQPE